MAQGVALLVLMFASVWGFLAFTRVSTLETAMEAIWATGPMNLLVNHVSIFFLVLVGVVMLGFLAGSLIWMFSQFK